jgi:hypothetical protein
MHLPSAEKADPLEHVITYTGKGSRSEARHGELRFRGEAIPDVFQWILDGETAYRFQTRSHMWGDDGYHTAYREERPAVSEQPITKDEKMRGWYEGAKRKRNTPEGWVYVEWKQGRAFADPAVLSELAEQQQLKAIPREGQMMMLPGRR